MDAFYGEEGRELSIDVSGIILDSERTEDSSWMIWIILLALIVIGAVIYYYKKKRIVR